MKTVKQHMGEQLELRRKASGLSQQELADHIGLTRVSVVNIEQGRCSTTPETVVKICEALHCTPNDLYPPIKPAKYCVRYVEKTVKVPKKVKVKKWTLPKSVTK